MKYDDAPKFRTSVEPDSGAPEHETRKRGHIQKVCRIIKIETVLL